MTRVAGVLRAHDLPVSSSHVIEAVRLAETLAVLRGRPLAGLAEVSEATKAVMCDGDDVAAAFVTRDLVVGELLGSVPDSAPPVPLDADVRGQAKTLRLKIDPLERTLALDLRREGDRARSVFLHRLGVLGIGWGEVTDDLVRGTGTFHETWSLRWRPELSVAIIDAAVWGTTVAGAASARIVSLAESADRLSDVTGAVVRVLLASLAEALEPVLRALDASGRRGRRRGVADDRGARRWSGRSGTATCAARRRRRCRPWWTRCACGSARGCPPPPAGSPTTRPPGCATPMDGLHGGAGRARAVRPGRVLAGRRGSRSWARWRNGGTCTGWSRGA